MYMLIEKMTTFSMHLKNKRNSLSKNVKKRLRGNVIMRFIFKSSKSA